MASFSVVNNIASLNAQANLERTTLGLQKALNRLSSGFRINMSGDDAAGLSVANAYRSDIAISILNANDGLSTLQIKDGDEQHLPSDRQAGHAGRTVGIGGHHRFQPRDPEFGVLGHPERDHPRSSGGEPQQQRRLLRVRQQQRDERDRVGHHLGRDQHGVDPQRAHHHEPGLAESAVAAVASAVTVLGSRQGTIGTLQNRMQFAISLAQNQIASNTAAESRIRDANIAEESANLTRFSILSQSGIAALAQANASTSSVLALLQ